MQKQLRIITRQRLAVCPLSSSLNGPVPPVPSSVFGRHFRRHSVHYHSVTGAAVIRLQSGWYVWCYPSGRRQLAALPF
jgi:hypothetical protein